MLVTVVCSSALRQYLMVKSVKVYSRIALLIAALWAQAAQDLLEGLPHVIVPEGVDDGIDEGVTLGQYQAVFLEAQHLAHFAGQTIKQQHYQARCPAENKEACQWTRGREKHMRK